MCPKRDSVTDLYSGTVPWKNKPQMKMKAAVIGSSYPVIAQIQRLERNLFCQAASFVL